MNTEEQLEMTQVEPTAWYPIGAVARKTGLSVHTLRAWERRYGVVEPRRSGGGTRQYSNVDVTRLRLLRRVTEAGHPISQVAGHTIESLRELLRDEGGVEEVGVGGPEDDTQVYVAEILKAVELMDGTRIQGLLMRAVVALSVRRVIDGVIVPVLREVGDRWAAGAVCPANEHLLSVHVRRVLTWLTEAVPVSGDAPAVVVTTPAGQWHELGAQIAGVLAAESGWRVVFLGPNLPAEDVARAVEVTGSRLVMLGVTMPDEGELLGEVGRLRAELPDGVEVVVGGRGVEPLEPALARMGVVLAPDFSALDRVLRLDGTGLGPEAT
jgi:MerR family transcriptional regulator, light-induced transcriptional regulator